jgi:hypothetical protein
MLRCYGHERCRLLFTDTDSLCYHIRTADAYRDMADMRELLDCSGYPEGHPLRDPANAKVAGKFKDETHGDPITEYVGLKPKMYAYCTVPAVLPQEQQHDGATHMGCAGTSGEPKECKRAKGVPRAALEACATLDDYDAVLRQATRMRIQAHAIRSWRHALYTISVDKVALSAFDSKRWVCDDGVRTLAYGHHSTLGLGEDAGASAPP